MSDELFPYLRRNQLGTLTLCGVDATRAPDGFVPNFMSSDQAIAWGTLHGLLPKNIKTDQLEVRPK